MLFTSFLDMFANLSQNLATKQAEGSNKGQKTTKPVALLSYCPSRSKGNST